jgi:hypothetical protein
MNRWFKLPLFAAAFAIVGGAGVATAAPGNAGSAAPTIGDTTLNGGATPVYHRHWHHGPRYWGPRYRYRYWRPYWRYYYGPRCYWSRYWHRTICR